MVFWKSQQGMSVLEVLVSVAIIGLIGGAVFTLLGSSVIEQSYAQQSRTGSRLVREGLEAIRQMRDANFTSLEIGTHGLSLTSNSWTFSGTSDITADVFERTVEISSIDADQVEATVTVSWTARGSRAPIASASTRFSNWRTLEAWGDWANPSITDSVYRLSNAAFEDESAYTPETNINRELRIWNNSDPEAPIPHDVRDLDSDGNDVVVSDGYLYVAAVNGLHIFEISTPNTPTEVGSLSFSTDAQAVAVRDQIVYIGTPDDDEELHIVDVSDKTNPVEIGTYNLPGTSDILAISARSSSLFVSTYENADTNPELYLFSISDLTSPTLLNSIDMGVNVYDVVAAGNYLFLATANTAQEFQVYTVSDPLSAAQISSIDLLNTATNILFQNNTAYVTVESQLNLDVIEPGS